MGRVMRWALVTFLGAVIAGGIITAALLGGWFVGRGTPPLAESARISGIVEYTVRDAQGNVKAHSVWHNTVLASALETTMRRLIDNTVGVTADTDTFRRIAALNNNEADDAIVGGILSTSVTLLLDGDGVAGGNQNPAAGTYADVGTTTDGQGRVQLTFTAAGAATIERLLLTKAGVDDTAVGGAVAIAEADIVAWQDVSIVLANADTLQITWTVNLD